MQKAFEGGVLLKGRFIGATPRLLRSIASKLEDSSKDMQANDSGVIEIASGIYIYYEPSLDKQSGPVVVGLEASLNK